MKNTMSAHNETSMSLRPQFGERGTITGRLHWDPLVYHCRDGSISYLFQVDSEPVREQSGAQMQRFLQMKAHVPVEKLGHTPFAQLRKGIKVTVEYVTRTDTYYNDQGVRVSKTYLSAETLYVCAGAPACGQTFRQESDHQFRRNFHQSPEQYRRSGPGQPKPNRGQNCSGSRGGFSGRDSGSRSDGGPGSSPRSERWGYRRPGGSHGGFSGVPHNSDAPHNSGSRFNGRPDGYSGKYANEQSRYSGGRPGKRTGGYPDRTDRKESF